MLHIRAIVPTHRTEDACAALADIPGTANVLVFPDAARSPAGDVVMCDVAKEATDDVIDVLREMDLDHEGSIAVEQIDVSISEVAKAAEQRAPGAAEDAVVWAELDRQTADEAQLTWAFLAFLALATQLAAIGVLTDSPILIVGAMVLGPEFSVVAAVCVGIIRRDLTRIGRAVGVLAVGFAVAIVVTLACAAVSRGLGWIGPDDLAHNERTDFIVSPDKWSFIVSLLAGAAGVLSITAGKSSALIGVFISVTTVPAAGNIADAIALTDAAEVRGSAIQLGVNLGGMVLSGTTTLLVQKGAWAVVRRRGRPPFRHTP